MAEGHAAAPHYPLGRLWNEVETARRRVNMRIADEALIMRDNILSILGGKKNQAAFQKTIKRLTDG